MFLNLKLALTSMVTHSARLARALWSNIADIWENETRLWENIKGTVTSSTMTATGGTITTSGLYIYSWCRK